MIPDLHIELGAGPLRVGFCQLDGTHEAALGEMSGDAAARARRLVQALAERIERGGAPVALETLTISEFDAVLAHLLTTLVGPEVSAQARCRGCGERFEFGLDIDAMWRALQAGAAPFWVSGGVATGPESGRRFRLPTLADFDRLNAQEAEEWLRGLLVEGSFDGEMEAELAQAAPVLSQDVGASCPHCDTTQSVRFDIAPFLVQTLSNDAVFLWREVHLLARSYGWSLTEILGLSRDLRRRLARLSIGDAAPLRAAS